MLIIFLIILVCCTAFFIYGSFAIDSRVFSNAVCSLNTSQKFIALTFDDGPNQHTNALLNLLAKHNIKAVFFCVGVQIANNKQILKRIYNDGHVVANHSYNHFFNFPFFSRRKIENELNLCSSEIQAVTGSMPIWFRPPFGVTNPNVSRAAKNCNMKIMGWNVRSLDTVKSAEKSASRVINNLKSGAIILFHDNRENTVQILEVVIEYAFANGYKFVRADEFLNQNK